MLSGFSCHYIMLPKKILCSFRRTIPTVLCYATHSGNSTKLLFCNDEVDSNDVEAVRHGCVPENEK